MINDADIREYLLGRLDADLELVERIDEQMFADSEFSTRVDIVEDEIIEAYIEGSLNTDDVLAVERHFLRPPERLRKLRNARLLSCHLAGAPYGKEKSAQPEPSHGFFHAWTHAWARAWKLPGLRAYAEVAACVLFAASIAHLMQQRRELGIAVERTNQQLAEQRQQTAGLQQQLRSPLRIVEPSTGVLNLLESGRTRGDGHLPAVKVGAASGTLHVEVAIPSDRADRAHRPIGTYRVRLEHDGQTLWSHDGVDALAVRGGAILKLDLPAEVLPLGACELVVEQPNKADLSYSFLVSDLR